MWLAKKKVGEVQGGGGTLNGIRQKTGRRNRRYSRNCDYRLLPKRPQRGTLSEESASVACSRRVSTRPPYASLESPAEVQTAGFPSQWGFGGSM